MKKKQKRSKLFSDKVAAYTKIVLNTGEDEQPAIISSSSESSSAEEDDEQQQRQQRILKYDDGVQQVVPDSNTLSAAAAVKEILRHKAFVDSYFHVEPDVASTVAEDIIATTAAAVSSSPAPERSKKKNKSIVELEAEARIDAIRARDPHKNVKLRNLIQHLSAALEMTENGTTMMLQLFKRSGLMPDDTESLPMTGKGLMKLPKAEMTKARLEYE